MQNHCNFLTSGTPAIGLEALFAFFPWIPCMY